MQPISIEVGDSHIIVQQDPSLGYCTACKHQRYESLKHPEWFSCHCAVPAFEVIVPAVPAQQQLAWEDWC